MKTTTQFLTLAAVASFSLLSLNSSSIETIQDHVDTVEFSINPPAGRSGAPNVGTADEQTCTACHSGSILSAVGVVDLSFNAGGTAGYNPGETYPMEISVSTGNKSGFQLTVLNSNLQKAGDLGSGTTTSVVTAGGREYIRQTAANGITSYSFDWTAPATNVGDVMAYFTFNIANGNSSSSGDLIYKGSALIPSNEPVSIGGFDENPNQVKTYWDASARQIHLDYALAEYSTIVVNVQTLQGQLVQTTTIGEQAEGQYHHILDGSDIASGVYIISVFVNNHVFNQKTLFN